MVRVRFAGVVRLRKDGLVCGFWLKRRVASPRFSKVEHLGRSDWVYQFVLRDEAELDDEVLGWIREAYDVGRQTHLAPPRSPHPLTARQDARTRQRSR